MFPCFFYSISSIGIWSSNGLQNTQIYSKRKGSLQPSVSLHFPNKERYSRSHDRISIGNYCLVIHWYLLRLKIAFRSAIEYHFFSAFPDTTEAAIRPVIRKYPYLRAEECIIADYWVGNDLFERQTLPQCQTADGQLRWPQVLAMIFFSTSFSFGA